MLISLLCAKKKVGKKVILDWYNIKRWVTVECHMGFNIVHGLIKYIQFRNMHVF